MKIPFEKPWMVLEREDYAHYIFVVSTWEGYTANPKKWGFQNARFLSAEYQHGACVLFTTLDCYKELSQGYFQSLFTHPGNWDRIHRETKHFARQLFALSKKIKRMQVEKMLNKDLVAWRKKIDVLNVEIHTRRGCMFFIETVDNLLTNYLHGYLSERSKDLKIKSVSPALAFQILTTPHEKSAINREKVALLKIALIKNGKKREAALARHAAEYEWLEYGLQGSILSIEHFRKELNSLRKRNPKALLKKMQKDFTDLPKKQKKILKLYNIHPQHVKIFQIARDAIYCKGLGKDAQFHEFYCLEPLLREIGRRTGMTLEQIRFISIPDLATALLKRKDMSETANQNRAYSIHFADKGKTVFYRRSQAQKIMRKLKFIGTAALQHEGEEIKGQPAFAGKARGKVKIINTPQEMVKMHQGDVLVSHMTNPDIVPAMKKASAIVTDLGGITCHAAIVSRELKTPCVIGTKFATRVLKDGDRVEVDANKGVVRKI